jgi:hypothetical protein
MIIGKLELHIILSYVMELLFFGIIGVLQLKRVTKLSGQQESEPMYGCNNKRCCFSSLDLRKEKPLSSPKHEFCIQFNSLFQTWFKLSINKVHHIKYSIEK